jgi:hypothetical protein
MPTIACAKCSAQLRIPDGASGKGKCPKCGTIFVIPARPAPQPAFEVVEDEPTPAAKQASPAPAAPAKPLDQTNDDDRPRTKKRSRDDDYDDDRPRAKRRRDDDDYDDDDDRRPVKKADPFGSAAIGAQLISIGLFCYAGMFALLGLYMLIGMFTTLSEGLFVLPALAGIAMTVLTIIGASFGIAGPARARGMAIATVAVSAAHVILVLVCYEKIGGGRATAILGGLDRMFLGTAIWVLDVVLPVLFYMPRVTSIDGEAVMFVLAGACELARMILVLLTLKAMALSAKDHDSAGKAGMGVVVVGIVCGAAAIVALVVVVIIDAAKMGRSAQYLAGVAATAISAGYAFMALLGALVAKDTRLGLARKARKG